MDQFSFLEKKSKAYHLLPFGIRNTTRMSTKLELAAQFVNSTAQHIFLTGKAGTGKTTFLHNLAQATHKNYLVVAPTGIAALNAKGVTIHSQFLFPFGTYLPQSPSFTSSPGSNFFSPSQLAQRHPLNAVRKNVLRSLDLLIIDEVSMLRADLLDAIDYRLKSAKGNFKQSFGGVQLLMIGDLYQLPPIVKDHEWGFLREHYSSIHFFQSQALRQAGFTYVELDKIFRQADDVFIRLLNALRNNACTEADLAQLNERYKPQYETEEGVVTLCTHNFQADSLNRQKLDALDKPSHFFEAEIANDFPQNLYPLGEKLELREGAQVMFVKNDTSEDKRYFNGKLAQVTELGAKGICVKMEGEDAFWLERHTWENKRYLLSEKDKQLEEEVIGTYGQYPIKLAWAITVHKSQGLTFEKAVIDVGKAFAPGQVYVALSRLRSLEGLVLRTPITQSAISSDVQVMQFSNQQQENEHLLDEKLSQGRADFVDYLIQKTFDFNTLLKQIEYIQNKAAGKLVFEDDEMREAVNTIRKACENEVVNTQKFRQQLQRILGQGDEAERQKRLGKGCAYYISFLESQTLALQIHLGEVRQFTRTKTYSNALEDLQEILWLKLKELMAIEAQTTALMKGEALAKNDSSKLVKLKKAVQIKAAEYLKENPKNFKNKTGKKAGKAKPKGETYQRTYALVTEGLKIKEIAEKRDLAVGTIESHLAKGITEGLLKVKDVMDEKTIKDISATFTATKEDSLTEVFKKMEGAYSYGQLRMVQAHLRLEKGEG